MKERIILILRTIITMTVALIIIQINSKTFADVGSFEDYSSGSDWGSSSDWSSSSSDWGSSSSSWDWDDDDDYSWGSSSSGSSGSLVGSLMGFVIIGSFIAVAILINYLNMKNDHNRKSRIDRNLQYYSNNKSKINYDNFGVLATIRNIDPNFSKTEFESFAKETFIKLQNAWTDRDWEKIRPFETPELFAQHKAQLDGYIRNNQINVMDRICVNEMNLVSFGREGEKDILVVDLNTRMGDYIIDATTKEVVKGDKNKEYYHTYTLTFVRTAGTVTQKEDTGLKTTNCPNCGAPTTITSSGRCEYCNSIITTKDHGWVLSSLKRRN